MIFYKTNSFEPFTYISVRITIKKVIVKLIFTAEVAKSAEKRKYVFIKSLRSPRSLRLNKCSFTITKEGDIR